MIIKFVTLLCLSKVNRASIAGLTFMDDFDFEQRYRNLHECDPFYWHPLHLPEKCADMFAKLIRSRINTPYSVITESEPYRYRFVPLYAPEYNLNTLPIRYTDEYDTALSEEIMQLYKKPRNPMEKLFNMLKQDVKNIPSAAKLVTVPYFGGVALYKQPVSGKTEAMIKKMSQIYAKATYFR